MKLFLCLTVVLGAIIQSSVCLHPKHQSLAAMRGSIEGYNPPMDQKYDRNRRQSRPQPVSIRQMMSALESIGQGIRTVDNKLTRHEYRENQVADFVSKTLNSLTADHTQATEAITNIRQQLSTVEERVLSIVTLVQASDERQRITLAKLSEGLDRLLVAAAPHLGNDPGAPDDTSFVMEDMSRTVSTIGQQLNQLKTSQEERFRGVSSQVQQLHDSLGQQTVQLSSKQDTILSGVEVCAASASNNIPMVNNLACETMETDVKEKLSILAHMAQNQERLLVQLQAGSEMGFSKTHDEIEALAKEVEESEGLLNRTFGSLLYDLRGFQSSSETSLASLHNGLKTIIDENSELISQKVEAIETGLSEGQALIRGAIDDAASMTDTLQTTVSDNYELLSEEISGLNKVEQVMINTADAVLDTKRSIEFGIQQVILELGEIVSQSGSTINSTLSDQINAISFNILKNQTSALTNMTKKMEGEISQVWRQIGILYQQVEQSISMLDNLQDTTNQHMNASLSRVGNMDGTVGEISGKVADVEDNLNYLLGRLTLVLSEFNQMKGSIASELNRLSQMATEVTLPDGNPDNLTYNINRKRYIVDSFDGNIPTRN